MKVPVQKYCTCEERWELYIATHLFGAPLHLVCCDECMSSFSTSQIAAAAADLPDMSLRVGFGLLAAMTHRV
jgi:hypothetical protein